MADSRAGTTAVIVNYRTKELTRAAAFSALREPEVREVLIVDNASHDGSAEYLRSSLPASTVQLIDAHANLGFGRAVNLAVPRATSGLLLLLNSDATLVPGAVSTLAVALLADDAVGLVAPAVYEADGRTLQPGAHGCFPSLVARPHRLGRSDARARTPDWVSGVTMMLRKEDFLRLGGFDEDFGMYLEDVDLCRRLRNQGRIVLREPAAGVIHLGGQSWKSSVDMWDHYHKSKITYFRKQGAAPALLTLLQVLRAARVSAARFASVARRNGAWTRPSRPSGIEECLHVGTAKQLDAGQYSLNGPRPPLQCAQGLDVIIREAATDLPSRVSGDNGIGPHIAGDDGAGPDDGAVSDGRT